MHQGDGFVSRGSPRVSVWPKVRRRRGSTVLFVHGCEWSRVVGPYSRFGSHMVASVGAQARSKDAQGRLRGVERGLVDVWNGCCSRAGVRVLVLRCARSTISRHRHTGRVDGAAWEMLLLLVLECEVCGRGKVQWGGEERKASSWTLRCAGKAMTCSGPRWVCASICGDGCDPETAWPVV